MEGLTIPHVDALHGPRRRRDVAEPVARIAIRPTYTPALARADGTCARTMSPVLNPSTTLVALGALSGNPVAFVRHICRLCRPVARMATSTTPRMSSVAGVLAPTQVTLSQCILGRPRCVRFHLVCPPVPVSRGNPSALRRWKSAQRVAFTAAASRNGCFACAWIWGYPNSSAVRLPLVSLQSSQARVRLDTRFEPCRTRGTICSTCSGRSVAPQ